MRRLLIVVLLLLAGCGAAAPVDPPPPSLPRPVTERPAVAAARVLRAWDERRAQAWATGSTPALRALYVPGSPAGQADVAMLRAWQRQGLRVDRLATQLLDVRVLHARPDRYRLRVRDRVVSATAVGSGVRLGLGRGAIRRHTITLVRRHGAWLVADAKGAAG